MIETKHKEWIFPGLSAAIVHEGSTLHPSSHSRYPINYILTRKNGSIHYTFCTHKNDKEKLEAQLNQFRYILKALGIPQKDFKCELTHSASVNEYTASTTMPAKVEALWKLKV